MNAKFKYLLVVEYDEEIYSYYHNYKMFGDHVILKVLSHYINVIKKYSKSLLIYINSYMFGSDDYFTLNLPNKVNIMSIMNWVIANNFYPLKIIYMTTGTSWQSLKLSFIRLLYEYSSLLNITLSLVYISPYCHSIYDHLTYQNILSCVKNDKVPCISPYILQFKNILNNYLHIYVMENNEIEIEKNIYNICFGQQPMGLTLLPKTVVQFYDFLEEFFLPSIQKRFESNYENNKEMPNSGPHKLYGINNCEKSNSDMFDAFNLLPTYINKEHLLTTCEITHVINKTLNFCNRYIVYAYKEVDIDREALPNKNVQRMLNETANCLICSVQLLKNVDLILKRHGFTRYDTGQTDINPSMNDQMKNFDCTLGTRENSHFLLNEQRPCNTRKRFQPCAGYVEGGKDMEYQRIISDNILVHIMVLNNHDTIKLKMFVCVTGDTNDIPFNFLTLLDKGKLMKQNIVDFDGSENPLKYLLDNNYKLEIPQSYFDLWDIISSLETSITLSSLLVLFMVSIGKIPVFQTDNEMENKAIFVTKPQKLKDELELKLNSFSQTSFDKLYNLFDISLKDITYLLINSNINTMLLPNLINTLFSITSLTISHDLVKNEYIEQLIKPFLCNHKNNMDIMDSKTILPYIPHACEKWADFILLNNLLYLKCYNKDNHYLCFVRIHSPQNTNTSKSCLTDLWLYVFPPNIDYTIKVRDELTFLLEEYLKEQSESINMRVLHNLYISIILHEELCNYDDTFVPFYKIHPLIRMSCYQACHLNTMFTLQLLDSFPTPCHNLYVDAVTSLVKFYTTHLGFSLIGKRAPIINGTEITLGVLVFLCELPVFKIEESSTSKVSYVSVYWILYSPFTYILDDDNRGTKTPNYMLLQSELRMAPVCFKYLTANVSDSKFYQYFGLAETNPLCWEDITKAVFEEESKIIEKLIIWHASQNRDFRQRYIEESPFVFFEGGQLPKKVTNANCNNNNNNNVLSYNTIPLTLINENSENFRTTSSKIYYDNPLKNNTITEFMHLKSIGGNLNSMFQRLIQKLKNEARLDDILPLATAKIKLSFSAMSNEEISTKFYHLFQSFLACDFETWNDTTHLGSKNMPKHWMKFINSQNISFILSIQNEFIQNLEIICYLYEPQKFGHLYEQSLLQTKPIDISCDFLLKNYQEFLNYDPYTDLLSKLPHTPYISAVKNCLNRIHSCYNKAFVVYMHNCLQKKLLVLDLELEYMIDQLCEESLLEIDVTQYIVNILVPQKSLLIHIEKINQLLNLIFPPMGSAKIYRYLSHDYLNPSTENILTTPTNTSYNFNEFSHYLRWETNNIINFSLLWNDFEDWEKDLCASVPLFLHIAFTVHRDGYIYTFPLSVIPQSFEDLIPILGTELCWELLFTKSSNRDGLKITLDFIYLNPSYKTFESHHSNELTKSFMLSTLENWARDLEVLTISTSSLSTTNMDTALYFDSLQGSEIEAEFSNDETYQPDNSKKYLSTFIYGKSKAMGYSSLTRDLVKTIPNYLLNSPQSLTLKNAPLVNINTSLDDVNNESKRSVPQSLSKANHILETPINEWKLHEDMETFIVQVLNRVHMKLGKLLVQYLEWYIKDALLKTLYIEQINMNSTDIQFIVSHIKEGITYFNQIKTITHSSNISQQPHYNTYDNQIFKHRVQTQSINSIFLGELHGLLQSSSDESQEFTKNRQKHKNYDNKISNASNSSSTLNSSSLSSENDFESETSFVESKDSSVYGTPYQMQIPPIEDMILPYYINLKGVIGKQLHASMFNKQSLANKLNMFDVYTFPLIFVADSHRYDAHLSNFYQRIQDLTFPFYDTLSNSALNYKLCKSVNTIHYNSTLSTFYLKHDLVESNFYDAHWKRNQYFIELICEINLTKRPMPPPFQIMLCLTEEECQLYLFLTSFAVNPKYQKTITNLFLLIGERLKLSLDDLNRSILLNRLAKSRMANNMIFHDDSVYGYPSSLICKRVWNYNLNLHPRLLNQGVKDGSLNQSIRVSKALSNTSTTTMFIGINRTLKLIKHILSKQYTPIANKSGYYIIDIKQNVNTKIDYISDAESIIFFNFEIPALSKTNFQFTINSDYQIQFNFYGIRSPSTTVKKHFIKSMDDDLNVAILDAMAIELARNPEISFKKYDLDFLKDPKVEGHIENSFEFPLPENYSHDANTSIKPFLFYLSQYIQTFCTLPRLSLKSNISPQSYTWSNGFLLCFSPNLSANNTVILWIEVYLQNVALVFNTLCDQNVSEPNSPTLQEYIRIKYWGKMDANSKFHPMKKKHILQFLFRKCSLLAVATQKFENDTVFYPEKMNNEDWIRSVFTNWNDFQKTLLLQSCNNVTGFPQEHFFKHDHFTNTIDTLLNKAKIHFVTPCTNNIMYKMVYDIWAFCKSFLCCKNGKLTAHENFIGRLLGGKIFTNLSHEKEDIILDKNVKWKFINTNLVFCNNKFEPAPIIDDTFSENEIDYEAFTLLFHSNEYTDMTMSEMSGKSSVNPLVKPIFSSSCATKFPYFQNTLITRKQMLLIVINNINVKLYSYNISPYVVKEIVWHFILFVCGRYGLLPTISNENNHNLITSKTRWFAIAQKYSHIFVKRQESEWLQKHMDQLLSIWEKSEHNKFTSTWYMHETINDFFNHLSNFSHCLDIFERLQINKGFNRDSEIYMYALNLSNLYFHYIKMGLMDAKDKCVAQFLLEYWSVVSSRNNGLLSIPLSLTNLNSLKRRCRLIHYVKTPILFDPEWRKEISKTRSAFYLVDSSHNINLNLTTWINLYKCFMQEYVQYLLHLEFYHITNVSILNQEKSDHDQGSVPRVFMQKCQANNGILLVELYMDPPFFVLSFHLYKPPFLTRNCPDETTNTNFLQTCEMYKVLCHLHSFAYDFHLRILYTNLRYSHCLEPRPQLSFQLPSNFNVRDMLTDFINYYNKAPGFSRNLLMQETLALSFKQRVGISFWEFLLRHTNELKYALHAFHTLDESINNAPIIFAHFRAYNLPNLTELMIRDCNVDLMSIVYPQSRRPKKVLDHIPFQQRSIDFGQSIKRLADEMSSSNEKLFQSMTTSLRRLAKSSTSTSNVTFVDNESKKDNHNQPLLNHLRLTSQEDTSFNLTLFVFSVNLDITFPQETVESSVGKFVTVVKGAPSKPIQALRGKTINDRDQARRNTLSFMDKNYKMKNMMQSQKSKIKRRSEHYEQSHGPNNNLIRRVKSENFHQNPAELMGFDNLFAKFSAFKPHNKKEFDHLGSYKNKKRATMHIKAEKVDFLGYYSQDEELIEIFLREKTKVIMGLVIDYMNLMFLSFNRKKLWDTYMKSSQNYIKAMILAKQNREASWHVRNASATRTRKISLSRQSSIKTKLNTTVPNNNYNPLSPFLVNIFTGAAQSNSSEQIAKTMQKTSSDDAASVLIHTPLIEPNIFAPNIINAGVFNFDVGLNVNSSALSNNDLNRFPWFDVKKDTLLLIPPTITPLNMIFDDEFPEFLKSLHLTNLTQIDHRLISLEIMSWEYFLVNVVPRIIENLDKNCVKYFVCGTHHFIFINNVFWDEHAVLIYQNKSKTLTTKSQLYSVLCNNNGEEVVTTIQSDAIQKHLLRIISIIYDSCI